MKILKSIITEKYSKVLTVTITNARNYQGQYSEAIDLITSNNREMNLEYFFAENIGENVYNLSFKIK